MTNEELKAGKFKHVCQNYDLGTKTPMIYELYGA